MHAMIRPMPPQANAASGVLPGRVCFSSAWTCWWLRGMYGLAFKPPLRPSRLEGTTPSSARFKYDRIVAIITRAVRDTATMAAPRPIRNEFSCREVWVRVAAGVSGGVAAGRQFLCTLDCSLPARFSGPSRLTQLKSDCLSSACSGAAPSLV